LVGESRSSSYTDGSPRVTARKRELTNTLSGNIVGNSAVFLFSSLLLGYGYIDGRERGR
jgi:hypothetical protein